ncbi:hypothetical protein THRCLA_03293, partial [Thraustotheca clavata]
MWIYGGFSIMTNTFEEENVAYNDMLVAPLKNLPHRRYDHGIATWSGHLLLYGGLFQYCLGDLWLRNTSTIPIIHADESTPSGDQSSFGLICVLNWIYFSYFSRVTMLIEADTVILLDTNYNLILHHQLQLKHLEFHMKNLKQMPVDFEPNVMLTLLQCNHFFDQ